MIQIKPSYSQSDIDRVNSLIQKALTFFDTNHETVSGDNIWKLEDIEFVILDNLEQMGNFKEEFFSIRASYRSGRDGFMTVIHEFLKDLGKSDKEKNFSSLIEIANNYLLNKKNDPEKVYILYIPTRLEFDLKKEEENNLKKEIKMALGIRVIKKLPKEIKRQLIPKSENLIKLFDNRQIILEIKSKSKDLQFSLDNDINPPIDSLLGIIGFAHYSVRSNKMWGLYDDVSIAKTPLEKNNIFVLLENEKIVHPQGGFGEDMLNIEIKKEDMISEAGKFLWSIHNKNEGSRFDLILTCLKILKKQSKKLQKETIKLFSLYFEALSEENLVISFFKFWILSEKILKLGSNKTGGKIVSIMKKFLKEDYSKNRIENLYKKRNDLVHEYAGDHITLDDRDTIKLMSEVIFKIYLEPPTKFSNLPEFDLILDNILLNEEYLKTKISILKKILKNNFVADK